jgi:hypothetical protein
MLIGVAMMPDKAGTKCLPGAASIQEQGCQAANIAPLAAHTQGRRKGSH